MEGRRRRREMEWNSIRFRFKVMCLIYVFVFFFLETGNSVEEIKDNLYIRDVVYISYWSWYLQWKKR